MGTVKILLHETLRFVGSVLLVTVGLLLLAVIAVAIRPLLFIGFILAGLAGMVISHFSPGFRDWFERLGEPPAGRMVVGSRK